MRTLLTTLLALVFAGVGGAGASAQVNQSGTVTAGHPAQWVTNNVIKDGGAATNGSLTGVGIQSSNGCSLGINSGPVTGSYTQLCIGVSPTSGSIFFNDTAFGGATHIPITFTVNSNPSLTINDTGILVNGQPVGGITIPNNTLLGNTSGITSVATAQSAGAVTTLLGLGTAAFVNTGSSGATVPFLNVANTWGATQTFPANSLLLSQLPQAAAGTVIGNATSGVANVTATIAPVLGSVGSAGGSIQFIGAISGSSTIRVAAAGATASTFQLPATNGTSGFVLQTDGSGVTSWAAAGSGSGTVNSGTANQMTYYAGSGTAVSGNANATISSGALTLGQASSVAGSLILSGLSSGTGVIQVAAAAGSGIVFQIPSANGTSGQFLQTNGSGVTSWQSPTGSGTVNSGTAGQLAYYATSTTAVSGNTLANISSGTLTLGLANTTAGQIVLEGATSGGLTIKAAAVAGSNTLTFPAGTTDFSGTGGTSQVLKQTASGGAITVARLACADLSDSGTGCSAPTGTLTTQSGTTYTMAAGDCGTIVQFTNASAVAVTLPNSLVVGCSIGVLQIGAGQITFSAGSGATLHSAHSYTKTFGQYAGVSLSVYSNGGSAAIYDLVGDGA